MPGEEVDAGRLSLDVVADVSGLRRDLKAKLDAAVADVRVKVRAELDARQLASQARQAAREASNQASVRVRAEFSVAQVRSALRAALREAQAGAAAKAEVTFDAAKTKRNLREAVKQASAGERAEIPVSADTTRMRTEIDAARREQEARPVKIKTQVDTSALGKLGDVLGDIGDSILSVSRVGAISSGITAAAGAAVNLAGALFSVVAAGSQAVGVLSALPGLVSAGVQGVSALALGLSGIGGAVKALTTAHQQAATGAAKNANTQANAAGQIKSAEQSLANARYTAARSVASAQDTLTQALQSQKDAQTALTQAYKDAREELQQLQFDAADAALAERQAEIDVEKARQKLVETQQSVTVTPLDKRQAQLDYDTAVERLKEAKDKASDTAKANAEAQRKGVAGSATVVAAKKAETQANREVKKAESDLADARRSAALQVQQAQEALARAQRAATQTTAAQTAATTALGNAMANLSPAGRAFAEFIAGTLLPRFYAMRAAVQEALLPPLQRGIVAALPLLDVLQAQLVRTGTIIGQFAERAGQMAGSAPFRRDTATIMSANNDALTHFGQAGLYVADALRNIMVVASPLVVRFSQWVQTLARAADEQTKVGRASGSMAAFFERAWNTARTLKNILDDVAVSILNIGRAATPAGTTLLDGMAAAADRLRQWTADPVTQARMREFFTGTIPVARQFGDLLKRIIDFLVHLGQITGGHTFDGLFMVLDTAVKLLDALTRIPGAGGAIQTILLLSGAGLGLGLVAKGLGGIVTNIGKLAKFTGTSKLLGMLTGGRVGKKTALGALADDAAKMGSEIDKELPKDKRKSEALDGVAGSARKGSKELGGAAGEAEKLGTEAERAAGKSSRFARVLESLSGWGGKLVKALGAIGTAIVTIPGLDTLAAKIGKAFGGLFTKIKVPGVEAATSSLRRFFSDLIKFIDGEAVRLAGSAGRLWRDFGASLTRFKLPASGSIVGRVGAWFEDLGGAIGKRIGTVFSAKWLLRFVKVGGTGAAEGSEGGPLGIIGGILGAIVGELIGGGKGGVRGGIGGAVSGGATGAGIGATIGSIFPGIGTAIGAAIGAVVGALIGALSGARLWGAIGRFFTSTLPGWIIDGVEALPGLVVKGLSAGTSLSATLGAWLLGQLEALRGWAGRASVELAAWMGRQLLSALRNLPSMIVDAIFAIPELVGKAVRVAPDMFLWLITQVYRVEKKIRDVAFQIPKWVIGGIALGASRGIDAFGWLIKEGLKLGPQLLRIGLKIPGWVAAGIRNPQQVFDWLIRQIKALPGLLAPLADRAMKAVADAMGDGMKQAAARVRMHLGNIGADFLSAGTKWVAIVTKMLSAIAAAVSERMKEARTWVTSRLSDIEHAFGAARDWVSGAARSMFSFVADHARTYLGKAKATVGAVLSDIRGAFKSAVDYIGAQWSRVQNATAGPVRWIGNNVYNHGIKAIWDAVAKLVKMSPLPAFQGFDSGGLYSGRVLPGYTPGRDVHAFFSPTGGRVDMSGGEAIMVPEWTAAVGAGRIHAWNRLARTGGPAAVLSAMASEFLPEWAMGPHLGGFDGGGILGGIGGAISKFTNAAKGLFTDGLKTSAKWVLDPIMGALSGAMGGTPWGNLVGGMPPLMVNGFLDYLVKVIDPKLGGDAHGVVAAAKKYIGVGDDAGPNNNIFSRAFGMPGAPWCAMFASTAIKDAKAGKHYPGYPTAAVLGFYDAMTHVAVDQGRAGDLAVYYGPPPHHVNIIESKTPGGYMTIGGNQNALVQRGVRGGQSGVLRPTFATGGIWDVPGSDLLSNLVNNAVQIFQVEGRQNDDAHEWQTPLVRLMSALSPSMVRTLTSVLTKLGLTVTSAAGPGGGPLVRDSGGPVPPGDHWLRNGTGRHEWMLTGPAADLLGGGRAVAALNAAAALRGGVVPAARPAAAAASGTSATVNVYPRPGHSEEEIGAVAARRIGAMLR